MTEPRRRAVLAGLGASLLSPWCLTEAQPLGSQLLAAWQQGEQFHVGVLSPEGTQLRVRWSQVVPTRAHGLLVEPEGSVLALARRPGEWLLRLWPGSRRPSQWLWSEPDRRFNGHAQRSANGRWLYTVESDLASGQSLIVRREAQGLAVDAEWATGGIDAHQLLHWSDDQLLVANGGVPTQPETGRARLAMDRMASSLVLLSLRDGRQLGSWRLADPRLSLRHLARHADGTVGIALQAEHDDAEQRASAPLLALFDGQSLSPAAQDRALAGYGGDVLATGAGFTVSATRAGGLAHWDSRGRWLGWQPLAEACALAPGWAGGREGAMPLSTDSPLAATALRLDNHWLRLA